MQASVISSHKDHPIKVWPTSTLTNDENEQLVHPSQLEGHTNAVSGVVVNPRKKIISVSWDKTIKVWDPATQTCEKTLTGHTDEITSVCTHKDNFLVTGGFDTNVHLWNLDEGKEELKMTMGADEAAVWCLTSDYNNNVYAGSIDMKIRVFDLEKQKIVQNLNGHKGHVRSLYYDHQVSNLLYSSSADGTIRVWDLRNKKVAAVMTDLGENTGMCMAFYGSQGNQYLASGATDGFVRVFDLRQYKKIRQWRSHTAVVTCITALPTGHLVTGSSDKMIRVWNPEQEDDCKAVVEAGDLVLSLASYSP